MKTALSHPLALRTLGIIAGLLVAVSLLAYTIRKPIYRTIADGAWDLRASHGIVDLIADKGLLALIAITAVVALVAWRRGAESFFLLVSAGVGTICAYASSETIKMLVTEERPCRVIPLDTILACPTPGDWSWPSNHATIAAALATACILVLPRIWALVAPIALLIAFSRVAAGVHYLHDVAAGLALGLIVTSIVGLLVNLALSRTLRLLRYTRSDRSV